MITPKYANRVHQSTRSTPATHTRTNTDAQHARERFAIFNHYLAGDFANAKTTRHTNSVTYHVPTNTQHSPYYNWNFTKPSIPDIYQTRRTGTPGSPATSTVAGSSISRSRRQSRNARFPIRLRTLPLPNVTRDREEQLKQPSPISSTLAGSSISRSRRQSRNA